MNDTITEGQKVRAAVCLAILVAAMAIIASGWIRAHWIDRVVDVRPPADAGFELRVGPESVWTTDQLGVGEQW